MILYKLSSGDEVNRVQKSIIITFIDKRKVLSTSHINGGYREDLKSVFNFDSNPEKGKSYCLRSDTYQDELKLVARELGLDPEMTAGISTAVSMDNVSIKTSSYEDLTVTAIVTAGIEVNAGRIGDPASFHEKDGNPVMIKPGTINIILHIDADMPPGTLARTMVTCTEAKTVAIQELMARSMYSRGLATGSGTDETIIICNSNAPNQLTFAGKHSKLGELIGLTVKSAVKEALFLQTGLNPKRQHSIFKRLDRFGIDEIKVWEIYCKVHKEGKVTTMKEFRHLIKTLELKSNIVTQSSLYAHLIDQLDWELLSVEEVAEQGNEILKEIMKKNNKDFHIEIKKGSIEETISSMVTCFIQLLGQII